jgi:hypothetical protein
MRGMAHLAALVVVLALPAAAHAADPLSFTAPQKLPQFAGGEPSITFDPNATGDTYVVAPQGIPSAAGELLIGTAAQGVGFWGSHDAGKTFPEVVNTGTGNGGGDSDVEVATDHTVFVADLEAADAAICISTDRGKTFPDCQNGTTSNHEGPENDRQWLTRGTKGELYLTYHDFTAGFPIIEKSTDGGQTFAPCGTIIDPSGPAAQTYTPQGGTLVSKPVVGADGTIYVEFTTPPQVTSPIGAPLSNLYMAVSPPGGCDGTTVFTDNVIYQNADADLGKIFQAEGIDGAGHVYVVAAGDTDKDQPNTDLWLFASSDGGKTWTAPRKINPPNLKSNVLPWVAGGRGGDELVVGWFGSEVSGDPNDAKNQWRYYSATSFSGGESFEYATITPDPIHYEDICTQGILCGLIPGEPGNRNLADFSTVAVNPANGCVAIALPGDPQNNNPADAKPKNDFSSSAYVALQNGGNALTPAGGSCGAAIAKPPDPAGAPTPVGSGNSVCGDRVEPRSSVSKPHARLTRRRVKLNGRSIDRVCNTGHKSSAFQGRVARVDVFVARHTGKRCRFMTAKGRLGNARSCARVVRLRARTRLIGNATNKTAWTFSRKVRLPSGRYRVGVRGTDSFGHRETRRRVYNTIELRVR